jgi:hypothetical protein
MIVLKFVLGIALLVMGRRMFWLCLGGIGFIFGFDFAEQMIHGQPQSIILIIALLVGILSAMTAIFFQKFAIFVTGFFGGGYLLIEFLKILGIRTDNYHWLIFIGGGVAGAILIGILFGWTLIVFSSLMGSFLILKTVHSGPHFSELFFILLMMVGIVIQSGLLKNHFHFRSK